jgi:hypothetical protein
LAEALLAKHLRDELAGLPAVYVLRKLGLGEGLVEFLEDAPVHPDGLGVLPVSYLPKPLLLGCREDGDVLRGCDLVEQRRVLAPASLAELVDLLGDLVMNLSPLRDIVVALLLLRIWRLGISMEVTPSEPEAGLDGIPGGATFEVPELAPDLRYRRPTPLAGLGHVSRLKGLQDVLFAQLVDEPGRDS